MLLTHVTVLEVTQPAQAQAARPPSVALSLARTVVCNEPSRGLRKRWREVSMMVLRALKHL